ncbi:hypothetical protein AS9A_4467 [Hoyosella subflava DQS3-9A1]|uniref:Uncharacterized protein n=1 Tax=Hoyosella subflava (strain DSM 45089 / JCM 17490 / NBRC 109087 / DQS3-9A1) TaxID=443218 RepID=F6ENP3_HOYSD|nr:hypothetical protein AS9A_4467 [Hoyosella subflava DQS3-9A1]
MNWALPGSTIPRFSGRTCLVLFTPASGIFPRRPARSDPLSHPGMQNRVAAAAQHITYLLT